MAELIAPLLFQSAGRDRRNALMPGMADELIATFDELDSRARVGDSARESSTAQWPGTSPSSPSGPLGCGRCAVRPGSSAPRCDGETRLEGLPSVSCSRGQVW